MLPPPHLPSSEAGILVFRRLRPQPLASSFNTRAQSTSKACWPPLSFHPEPTCSLPACPSPPWAWMETGASAWVSPPPPSALCQLSTQPTKEPHVSLILSAQLKTTFLRPLISLQVEDLPGVTPHPSYPTDLLTTTLPFRLCSCPWPPRLCSNTTHTVTSGPLHLLFLRPGWFSLEESSSPTHQQGLPWPCAVGDHPSRPCPVPFPAFYHLTVLRAARRWPGSPLAPSTKTVPGTQ